MLYCRNCGQCSHIDDECFIQYADTSGWESYYIDADDGEHVEHKDSETTDSDITDTECGHCRSTNIEWDSEITQEEVFAQRAIWQRSHDDQMAIERLEQQERTKKYEEERVPQWDLDHNETEEVAIEA